MGGLGSGMYEHATMKPTDKESIKLCMKDLTGAGAVEWDRATQGKIKTQGMELLFTVQENILSLNGSAIRCSLILKETIPNYGGRRIWFTCPSCIKLCAVIYARPGTRQFCCFECSQLIRASNRKSKKQDRGARIDAKIARFNQKYALEQAKKQKKAV